MAECREGAGSKKETTLLHACFCTGFKCTEEGLPAIWDEAGGAPLPKTSVK